MHIMLSNVLLQPHHPLLQEQSGNLLVFMSTVGGVSELVQALQLVLAHDTGCSILGLYAALNSDEQAKVTEFDNLSTYPENRGKRMICVATNLVEAGVTIPGKLMIQDTQQPMGNASSKNPTHDMNSLTTMFECLVMCRSGCNMLCLSHATCITWPLAGEKAGLSMMTLGISQSNLWNSPQ